MPHLDIAAPGFDNLQYSTANVCGKKAGTGFESQAASEALGRWYEKCQDTAECIDLCAELEPGMRKGCQLFARWGWKRGDPKNVKFAAVECPSAFVKHIGSLFGADGPQEASADPVASSAQPSTSGTIDATTTGSASASPAASTTPATSSTARASSTTPNPTTEDDSVSIKPHEPEEAGGACLKAWSQCGGKSWKGQGTCCDGLQCHRDNDWWSACVPGASLAQAPAVVRRGARQASYFLAPIQPHMLREAPALVQGGSTLNRKGAAANALSHFPHGGKDEEL